jgi:hypothetical protein
MAPDLPILVRERIMLGEAAASLCGLRLTHGQGWRASSHLWQREH